MHILHCRVHSKSGDWLLLPVFIVLDHNPMSLSEGIYINRMEKKILKRVLSLTMKWMKIRGFSTCSAAEVRSRLAGNAQEASRMRPVIPNPRAGSKGDEWTAWEVPSHWGRDDGCEWEWQLHAGGVSGLALATSGGINKSGLRWAVGRGWLNMCCSHWWASANEING